MRSKLRAILSILRGGTVVYRATITGGQLHITLPNSAVIETTVSAA